MTQEEDFTMFDYHLFAVDAGEIAETAFDWACKNLPPKARFVIVHGEAQESEVVTLGENIIHLQTRYTPSKNPSDDSVLQKYKLLCAQNNRKCRFASIKYANTSDLGASICAIAKHIQANSVLCGSRRHGPVGRTIFGSTSASILQECNCPITIFPAKRKY
eukprot:TRINITY_DN7075_c0_g1_i1.p1 TRINITY_DN7075_c0_g1~~TRINITY_DN7075_c0_g1_i1.p1  ORF type:complete len:161 (+),score=8.15 TRINITY_DN7075_c0_g1_i1:86-568(+)